jgi:hypothetical protein
MTSWKGSVFLFLTVKIEMWFPLCQTSHWYWTLTHNVTVYLMDGPDSALRYHRSSSQQDLCRIVWGLKLLDSDLISPMQRHRSKTWQRRNW